jgi:hypothetical protein
MAQIHNLGKGSPNGIQHDAWDVQILVRMDIKMLECLYVHTSRTIVREENQTPIPTSTRISIYALCVIQTLHVRVGMHVVIHQVFFNEPLTSTCS